MKAAQVLIFGTAWTVIVGLFLGLDGVDGSSVFGEHGAWNVSRAAGFASYLFLWVGIVGGLVMSSAWLDGYVNRARLLAIHQVGSIAGVVLGVLHALALIPDQWTDFTALQVLVPFTAPDNTGPMALGVLSLYLAALVTASFWFRSSIGTGTWKLVHYAGFVAFGGALLHGITVGTDTGAAWAIILYGATGLSVVFAVVLRMAYRRQPVRRKMEAKAA